ncbi:hypothetical protein RUM44_001101 [Polyplax serrata]|uniref:Mannosyl-oligosaccharide glucosidase n=1 Tax=Polyplax serrata TaxID=468196 RepID=A0ABR1B9W8_POLSC
MARPRPSGGEEKAGGDHKHSSHQEKPQSDLSPVRTGITILCLVIAGVIGFKGYLETRVNTKFDAEKMVEKTGLEVPEMYWGSYRPGLYFGMKTRDPYSLVSGLMWYFPKLVEPGNAKIRHWCEQSDNLKNYTWTEHDGRNFGIQEIYDGPYHIQTSFVKRLGGNHGGDWTANVKVNSNQKSVANDEVSLIFYAAIEEKSNGMIEPSFNDRYGILGITGNTQGLGKFRFTVHNQTNEILHDSFLSTVSPGIHLLKETVINYMHGSVDKVTKKRKFFLPGEILQMANGERAQPNFVALHVTGKMPFEVAFVFESDSFVDRPNTLKGHIYEEELRKHSKAFHQRFEKTFHLEEKNYRKAEIDFAKAALSNLIGGIGYFYGASRVQSSHTKSTVPYWKAPLYTAVPSRSFFPRGFLWDEGFHGLLISAWDLDIELDIINHWFDLMNIEGWIPREQILGQEALSKVPEEFVTQHNTNANPPVFFLTLKFILRNFESRLKKESKLTPLNRLYPRLQAWFDWFNYTQVGDIPGSYRWQGRDAATLRELNPKTLTSGLDDYPRASHPTSAERHIDLRCWIAVSAAALSDISYVLNKNGKKYENTFLYLTDPKILNKLHWSEKTQRYADYGLHTDSAVLKRPAPTKRQPGQPAQNQEKIRVILKDPKLRFIDSTFGYVSLFPFLTEILEPNSHQLGQILNDLKNPDYLWTDYGLRSLSKTSPLYMQYNTEHDPPYWRGPIWMNMNYLVVKALNHYANTAGPYKEKARETYIELRKNLIDNVFKEYKRTGYIWEQYNDVTGEGQGSRPFTGWSSLVVLLMAEIY